MTCGGRLARTPYSRAHRSLNPAIGAQGRSEDVPALFALEKNGVFQAVNPLASPGADPHIDSVQALRGCACNPVRPLGRTIRISLN
jgi:hypothetical protein